MRPTQKPRPVSCTIPRGRDLVGYPRRLDDHCLRPWPPVHVHNITYVIVDHARRPFPLDRSIRVALTTANELSMKATASSSRRRVGVACAATAVSLAVGADAQWWRVGGGDGGGGGGGDSNQNSPPSRGWNEPARQGYTRPEELANLIIFRDAMRERGVYWQEATDNWTCGNETDPYQLASCNPCGNEAWGYWKHVGCRGDSIPATPWLFSSPGDGWVTDFHITDYKVTGSVGVDLDRRAPSPKAQTRRSRSRSRSLALTHATRFFALPSGPAGVHVSVFAPQAV